MDFGAIFPVFFAALVVTLLISWIKRIVANYNPIGNPSVIGTIKPDKGVIYFTLFLCFVFSVLGGLAIFFDDDLFVQITGGFIAFVAIGTIISLIPGLTSIQDIIWTNETVTGPRTVRFQIMGTASNELWWSKIVKIGLVKGPYHYLENDNGDRVYWSRSYENYQVFEATLAKHCPHLEWPEFELFPN